MKQQVTFGMDGRPSFEEMMSEDEARRRREQLNRRPSYRQILKDLETAGDKPMKREIEDNHLRQNGLGGMTNGVEGSSPYGSPISSNDSNAQMLRNRNDSGSDGASTAGSGMLLPGQRLNMSAAPPSLSNRLLGDGSVSGCDSGIPPSHLSAPVAASAAAGPLLSAAVAAAVGNSLILPTSVGGCADLIGLKPPASTVAAADALSAAVSVAAVSSAFSQNNDWKNSLLYNSNHSTSTNNSSMAGGGGGGGGGGIGPANTPGSMTSLSDNDDNNRKRQVRLLKNREAAKECRRKKKRVRQMLRKSGRRPRKSEQSAYRRAQDAERAIL